MRVLVIGASGFIGRHVVGRLLAEGMYVTVAGRVPDRLTRFWPGAAAMACDLSRDDSAVWAGRLAGIDAVVNCAGLMGDGADYAAVHDRGARALFDACLSVGMGRVIRPLVPIRRLRPPIIAARRRRRRIWPLWIPMARA
jgi:uncharacterized protein YbjT (DUF2867 family)